MKRLGTRLLSFCAACFMGATPVQSNGQTMTAPALAAPGGIVAINFNAAVLGTAEAQRSLGALQKKYAPREQELQSLGKDIETLKESLSNTAAANKWTDAERTQKLQEIETKEKRLQREAEDFKNDSQTESQQAFQQVAQKVFSFLQEFAQQHGYAAVLDRGTETAPVVWYTASNVDITDQLIRSYDSRPGSSSPTDGTAPRHTSPGTPSPKP